nr:GIY-YIG nuclease family protein [uncultured Halomonas sp.]
MSYIDKLIENCNRARSTKPVENFILFDMSDLDGIDKAIYIIEEVDGDVEKTFIELSNYKKTKQRKCPRLNAPSQVMYVGSSTTGVKKQIEQHLGNGPKDTYSLHLKHWFNGKYRITIKVYDESLEVIQIIEDALSHDLAPAFGKQGGNNK